MINARHVAYEQAFGVGVCVWVCVCGGGGGGDGRERKRTQRSSTAVRGLPGTKKKKWRKGGIITDVCSVDRDGRLSFVGT